MSVWANLRRLGHVARVMTGHGLAYAVDTRLPRWLPRRGLGARLTGPERLRVMFEEMGGTFIKFGQMLALQPDIVPLEYCNALFNLLDRVAPFGMEEVKRTFEEELGKSPQELFDEFDEEPLATASVGQVHVAWLRGRKLAVKVRRPSVEREFGGDVRLMVNALRLIKGLRLRRLQWLLEPLGEFIAWTREELDFRHEARHMRRLWHNARDNPAERVPQVLQEYTTCRTVVMEYLEGVTVLNYLRAIEKDDDPLPRRLAATGFDPNAFACRIIDNFLGDAFRYGTFHADLHPANLMILPGGIVGYVDFGIVGTLSRYSRQHLVAMTLAYTRGDIAGIYKEFAKVAVVGADSDLEGFHEGLNRLADEWYELRGHERRLRKNFTMVMMDMLELSRATGLRPEKDVIRYIRSAIAGDGLITRFAPQFDVGRYLERVCHQHLQWQSWAGLVTCDGVLSWFTAAAHLMQDGPQRGAGILRQIAGGELPAHAELGGRQRDPDAVLRVRALQFAGLAFGTAMLLRGWPEWRMQLLVADALVFLLALVLFVRAVHRPA